MKNGTAELVFVATVPALGFAVYDVRPSDVPCRLRGSLSISSENQMENQKYIVRLNKKGNITSILDKEMDEQELLAEPSAWDCSSTPALSLACLGDEL